MLQWKPPLDPFAPSRMTPPKALQNLVIHQLATPRNSLAYDLTAAIEDEFNAACWEHHQDRALDAIITGPADAGVAGRYLKKYGPPPRGSYDLRELGIECELSDLGFGESLSFSPVVVPARLLHSDLASAERLFASGPKVKRRGDVVVILKTDGPPEIDAFSFSVFGEIAPVEFSYRAANWHPAPGYVTEMMVGEQAICEARALVKWLLERREGT